MKVTAINHFFGKVGRVQVRFRWAILAIFFIITSICCSGLTQFAFSLGDEGWFGGSDEITINKKKYITHI